MPPAVRERLQETARRARRALEQARFAEAERLVRLALKSDGVPAAAADANEAAPERAELLYLLAVARRYDGRPEQAVATLDALLKLDPTHSRAWQETGHARLACGEAEAARRAYEQAVRLNPALPASWRALVKLYRRAGRTEALALAEERIDYLAGLPAPLLGVADLMHRNRLREADRLCRRFLQGQKRHPEGLRLLAGIAERRGALPDAEFLLETLLELAPEHEGAGYDLANLLLKMQKFEPALRRAQELVRRQPANPACRALLGGALAGVGRHREAIRLYNRVLAGSRGQHRLLVMRGHAEKTIGRLAAAVLSYQAAYALKPDYGDAFWSLANTKTYRFTDTELRQMLQWAAEPSTGMDDLTHLHFALGKAFEDRREPETAFFHYDRGNSLQGRATPYNPRRLEHRVRAQLEVCTDELLAKRHRVGAAAPDAIFIVGLPRSGSTLLEQILASHSQVDGTLELPHIHSLAQRLGREAAAGYPRLLAELDDGYFRRFAEQFLAETRVYRGRAPLFIDKNPNNFLHLGLIKLLLPNARLIDARRHPLACCFSNFKQLFGQGQEFSYSLAGLGHYYRQYVRLMAHWNAVLPGELLLVEYERVVADLEGEVRRLLDFCRLPFEAACLNFHETRRSIRTPSSEQVRQPVHIRGLNAWKPFAARLQPLVDALGEDICADYAIPNPLPGPEW